MTCSDLPVKNVQILSSNSENVLFSKGIRILYVLEGSCSFVINERSIYGQSGDFFFFLPSIQPGSVLLSGSVSSRLIWIAFDMSFFYEHVPGWEGLHVELSKNIERHRELFRQILTQIASVWFGSPKNRDLILRSLGFNLAVLLSDILPVSVSRDQLPHRSDQITFYLENNYERPVTLNEMAEYMHLSGAYLSRYIKAHFHKGFHEYLTSIRLEHAKKDLESTKISVTNVALNNGFPNVSSFNKCFKSELQMTPNQYRKRYFPANPPQEISGKKEVSQAEEVQYSSVLPLPVPLFSPESSIFSEISVAGETVNILMQSEKYENLDTKWHDMINLGFGLHCGQTKFQEQLSELLVKIPFTYGRIQGIFKDYAATVNAPESAYPFSELDSIFDFFSRLHLLPHIDFACMTHDPQYAGCPPDMGLIESFLKYYIKRYGQQVLSQWRFEYSMPFQEPGMAAFSPGEYALFCEKLENLIHRLIPHASFGCFFGSPMLPWDFVESMVEELSRRHMNLNYISLHLYPYEPPKDAGRHHLILSTDPDFFLNYIRKFRKIYANYFLEPLPIYVTYLQNETAPCPWTNDSAFMAPFLFKTYTELYRDVANIAYSAFSDIIYKNNSDNPYFSGGNGIITFHGIKKPSYFALFMLSKTPDRIFYHHKNAFITSMDENTCQILMYNYVHYTAAHCLNSQEQYPVYQIYEKLQSGNIIEFSFDFSQWPEGSYRIQKFILGPKHGSVLDEFIRLGIHDDMLPIELDYLDRKAGMDISVEYIHVDRGTRLTARLAPLEICVYVVYPIL